MPPTPLVVTACVLALAAAAGLILRVYATGRRSKPPARPGTPDSPLAELARRELRWTGPLSITRYTSVVDFHRRRNSPRNGEQ